MAEENEQARQNRLAARRQREAEKRKDPAYRQKLRDGQKRWRDANPEKVRATNQRMYVQNREAVLDRHAKWKAENRDAVRKSNEKSKFRQTQLKEPGSLAERAGAMRWNRMKPQLYDEQRREFVSDSLDADFANHAVVWFNN